MKKFLRFYLPLLIFLASLGIFSLAYMYENHNTILRYFAGEVRIEGKGKIISAKINAIVKKDGIEQDQVKLFDDEGKIYMVSPEVDDSGIYVLIIDKERKDVFVPIRNCHELLFSKYLIQSECGQRGDFYGGGKHEGYQVKLEASDSQINFQLPAEFKDGKVVGNKQIEIIFKGER